MAKPTTILSIDAAQQARTASRRPLSANRPARTRKQDSSASRSSEKKSGVPDFFHDLVEKLKASNKFRKGAIIGLVVVFLCLFLYPPTQQYYQAIRKNALLEAQYAAVTERLDALNSSVEALSEDAGIEDYARRQYGWVLSDENAVSVYGLEVQDDGSLTNAEGIPLHFSVNDVEMPKTWYSPVLDVIFGVG